jgi:hypothetical protein
MQEGSLWQDQPRPREAYRFLWIPHTENPVSIRIERSSGSAVLVVKMLDGSQGVDPGPLILNERKTITRQQWETLHSKLQNAKFWTLPSVGNNEQPNVVHGDGSSWVLEARKNDEYHAVDYWSPDEKGSEKQFRDLCLYFLNLSGIKVSSDKMY